MNRTRSYSVVVTPEADESYIAKSLAIFVEQPGFGERRLPNEFKFTYWSNPKLTRVHPLETVKR